MTRSGPIFVTGSTGYLGRALVPALAARGHLVRALVRPGSAARVPAGAASVVGDVLDPDGWRSSLGDARTLVHLVGVRKPLPWMARQFRDVDLASVRAMLAAIRGSSIRHVVYLSVAQPAPVMRAYIAARREAEILIRAEEYATTILRPWYVLGPGHHWPHALRPLYKLFEALPATRDTALRTGLLRLPEIVQALVWAVEHAPSGVRVLDVPRLRALGRGGREQVLAAAELLAAEPAG
ncbi:MAG: NAD(P)-dependent oxidoreductase [Planctomycetota bacterium]|nr:MAG: NAD(P)-dependent oxidoreductase [Planctomycetota bacterium]